MNAPFPPRCYEKNPKDGATDYVALAKQALGFGTQNSKAETIAVPAAYKGPRWQEPCTPELIEVFHKRFQFENVRKPAIVANLPKSDVIVIQMAHEEKLAPGERPRPMYTPLKKDKQGHLISSQITGSPTPTSRMLETPKASTSFTPIDETPSMTQV